ncbi:hypothetical protein HMPREF9413_0899 [Paenibacillus sp. HGF7]|nr:hypothetical protein HMPREF9413_0899 [Paenibacillus sp. HGF7]
MDKRRAAEKLRFFLFFVENNFQLGIENGAETLYTDYENDNHYQRNETSHNQFT